MLVQVLPFGSPRVGVHLIFSMSSSGECLGGMSTTSSAMMASGVSPSLVSDPRPNASPAHVVLLNFSTLVSAMLEWLVPPHLQKLLVHLLGLLLGYLVHPLTLLHFLKILKVVLVFEDFHGIEGTFLHPHLM